MNFKNSKIKKRLHIWCTCTNFLSDCFIDEMSTGSDGLVYDCQCAPGYKCVPTGEFALDKGPPGG